MSNGCQSLVWQGSDLQRLSEVLGDLASCSDFHEASSSLVSLGWRKHRDLNKMETYKEESATLPLGHLL